MASWDYYPLNYRSDEVNAISRAIGAGECASVIGLSGAGKSNLLGFIAHRVKVQAGLHFLLVDCNRLADFSAQSLYRLMAQVLITQILGPDYISHAAPGDDYGGLTAAVNHALILPGSRICFMLDRFDALLPALDLPAFHSLAGNLRAVRDDHKYDLTLVLATRRPAPVHTELDELVSANTLWLGPLNESDAQWSAASFARRRGLVWQEEDITRLVALSWGYPSFLRAACESFAAGAELNTQALLAHPAVQRRLEEFWADSPTEHELRLARLEGHPFLAGRIAAAMAATQPAQVDSAQLTAKEHLLLKYLTQHTGEVCEKDDLIRAVWPEDKVYEHGIRDDSLAQLVRRLREKVEEDPSNPSHILTVPGRGYRYI